MDRTKNKHQNSPEYLDLKKKAYEFIKRKQEKKKNNSNVIQFPKPTYSNVSE